MSHIQTICFYHFLQHLIVGDYSKMQRLSPSNSDHEDHGLRLETFQNPYESSLSERGGLSQAIPKSAITI